MNNRDLQLYSYLKGKGSGVDPAVIDQLEEAVTAIEDELTVVRETITPLSGTAGTGGCFYETYGKIVHFHFNLSDLTATTGSAVNYNTVFNVPEALRPDVSIVALGTEAEPGIGFSRGIVSASSGNINIVSTGTTAIVDILYIIPNS